MLFNKNKDVIGLDIGSSSIKLVELAAGKNGYRLKHFRIMPLPPEAIVDGSIMDSGVVVDSIRELISLEEVKTKNVAISVCGHSVIVKKIKLPLMTEDELEESIQWEAEQYIPFDISDVNLDVEILGMDEGEEDVGEMEVLLVAAKKDMIHDHTSVLEEAGLKPQIVDIDAFCIENMFEENYSGFNEGVVVLVNIGSNITNVNVLEGGVSAFTRDISIGGSQFTEEIQKQLNVSYDEAEALKIGGDLGAPTETTEAVIPQEVGSIIRSVSEGIAAEIQRSLDFYSATSNEEKINKLYLMGGSSRIPGLPAVIEGKIGVPSEIVNPFNNIEIDERDFNISHISEVAPAAAVAVGLALRKIGDS
ncbi:MAG: type IV pilus assembly protein PilM [Bdellovibrionales bacterium]|nr:type IV pilus assembly protein PilM [Bdellovibrionales bacterium]